MIEHPTVLLTWDEGTLRFTLANGAGLPHLIAASARLSGAASTLLAGRVESDPYAFPAEISRDFGESVSADHAVAVVFQPDVSVPALRRYGRIDYTDLTTAAAVLRVRWEHDLRQPYLTEQMEKLKAEAESASIRGAIVRG